MPHPSLFFTPGQLLSSAGGCWAVAPGLPTTTSPVPGVSALVLPGSQLQQWSISQPATQAPATQEQVSLTVALNRKKQQWDQRHTGPGRALVQRVSQVGQV